MMRAWLWKATAALPSGHPISDFASSSARRSSSWRRSAQPSPEPSASLGLAPVMFELGARPHPPQELYRAYLAESDIFIGLYWQSYGWIGPGMDISGLEDEFRLSRGQAETAVSEGTRTRSSAAAVRDDRPDPRHRRPHAYRTFRSSRELGRLVRDDLALLLSERFAQSAPGSAQRLEPTEAAPRRSLPVPSTSLIGQPIRHRRAVVSMLESPHIRLVTLTGPGGSGKTRLAIAVARPSIDAARCGCDGSSRWRNRQPRRCCRGSSPPPGWSSRGGEGPGRARRHFATTACCSCSTTGSRSSDIAPELDDLLGSPALG